GHCPPDPIEGARTTAREGAHSRRAAGACGDVDSRVELRVPDGEGGEAAGRRTPGHRDLFNATERGALLEIAHQFLDGRAMALDAPAPAPAPEVHDVADQRELGALALDEGAIPHALPPPVHHDLGGALPPRRVHLPHRRRVMRLTGDRSGPAASNDPA